MPAFIGGPIKIVSVSGGNINFGDTGFIAPKETSKSYSGSGGATGDFAMSINGMSNTNTVDSDAVDSNAAGSV